MTLTQYYFEPCQRQVLFVDPEVHSSATIWFNGCFYFRHPPTSIRYDDRLQEVQTGIYLLPNPDDQRCMAHLESAVVREGTFKLHTRLPNGPFRYSSGIDELERTALSWLDKYEFTWSHTMLEVSLDLPSTSYELSRLIVLKTGVHCTEVCTRPKGYMLRSDEEYAGLCTSKHWFGTMPFLEFASQLSRGTITLTTSLDDLKNACMKFDCFNLARSVPPRAWSFQKAAGSRPFTELGVFNTPFYASKVLPSSNHLALVYDLERAYKVPESLEEEPKECSGCRRPFDAYRKRFDTLCGDCVPK